MVVPCIWSSLLIALKLCEGIVNFHLKILVVDVFSFDIIKEVMLFLFLTLGTIQIIMMQLAL
jgi:hypothetical protein